MQLHKSGMRFIVLHLSISCLILLSTAGSLSAGQHHSFYPFNHDDSITHYPIFYEFEIPPSHHVVQKQHHPFYLEIPGVDLRHYPLMYPFELTPLDHQGSKVSKVDKEKFRILTIAPSIECAAGRFRDARGNCRGKWGFGK